MWTVMRPFSPGHPLIFLLCHIIIFMFKGSMLDNHEMVSGGWLHASDTSLWSGHFTSSEVPRPGARGQCQVVSHERVRPGYSSGTSNGLLVFN